VLAIYTNLNVEQRQTFRARLDEGPTLSAFVEAAVSGLGARLSMRLRLVVEELFVNTVTHGHGGDSDAPVDITILLADDRVVLTYVDVAPPFDPFAEVQEPGADITLDERPVGRVGVFLVTRFATRYEYARAGEANRVTVELSAGP
jgi:anti-sigma regulatory factor (Ser/Thr protein kinase)